MRLYITLLFCLFFADARAEPPAVSPELEQMLRANALAVQKGTNDPEQLFAGLRRLANQGDNVAQFLSGLFSFQTEPAVAAALLKDSADAGCAGSDALLAALTIEGPEAEDAAKRMFRAAGNGDASAQIAVSGFHERGDFGFEQSTAKSYAWSKLAERQTFSQGALQAIREQLRTVTSGRTESELAEFEREFRALAAEVPKVDYYLCGQMNVDTSRDPFIVNILQAGG